MKMSREQREEYFPLERTHDEKQAAVNEELKKWLLVRPSSLDENWNQVLEMKRLGQFVVDYADTNTLNTAVHRLIRRIMAYGKPQENKITIQTGVEITLATAKVHFEMSELLEIVHMLVCSALFSYQEEQKEKHKNVAKLRVDLHKRDLYKRIDEGEL